MARKDIIRQQKEKLVEEKGIIYLDNVSKSYSKGAPALDGVTLSIYPGEFVYRCGGTCANRKIHSDQAVTQGTDGDRRCRTCDG